MSVQNLHTLLSLCLALLLVAGCETPPLANSQPPPSDNGNIIDPNDASIVNNAPDPGPPLLGAPGDNAPPPEQPAIDGWIDTSDDYRSTFSADVDTASYSRMRRMLLDGALPHPSQVRVEEYLNYFDYQDPAPEGSQPLAVVLEAAPSPFDDGVQLLRIGMQAQRIPDDERDPVNLVFLVDVSGSMRSSHKLPLVKYALKQLVDKLRPEDTLGLVVYAGADRVVLEPTPVEDKGIVLEAIESLESGGSTNGDAGIRRAYELAEQAFVVDGVNRVVLCTDGDFNVGLTGDPLVELIEEYREMDVFLSILGFGSGNFNDELLEDLSNAGNGNYAFIDSTNEALRVLGEKLVSTLQVVAKDVKLQVTFNPGLVKRFRLIGYQNRLLADVDFANDDVDAGDIGAGHHVTALYALQLHEASKTPKAGVPLAEVAVRHKKPTGDESQQEVFSIHHADFASDARDASDDLRWAGAVAQFGLILSEATISPTKLSMVLEWAEAADASPAERTEFLSLVATAMSLGF